MEVPLNVEGEHTGESMLAPKIEARLLEALELRKHEHVLEIGSGSGYMAALLAHRARHVLTCEIHPTLARFAGANLERSGVRNVVLEHRDGSTPPGSAHYEAIVLSGSVPFVPEPFLRRLTVGGRLVAIVGELPVMEAQLIRRTGEDSFAQQNLFETVAAPLLNFPKKNAFRF
jgi:protein-L-isoaspartate(D-aspartate) O-methyltransferase